MGKDIRAIVIRQAIAEDNDALCAIIDEVDSLHRDRMPHIFQKPPGPVCDREYILGLLADDNVGFFIADVEGQVAGFVHVLVRDTPPGRSSYPAAGRLSTVWRLGVSSGDTALAGR